jgi:Raf kinase inhibitor-like YbhB/YbcL family protein
MKKLILSLCIAATGTVAFAQTFTLKSADVGGQATDKQFFNSFGCTGQNVSPHLSWETAPKDAVAFAVTMYDKDAPTGSGFWHWVVFNIPGNVTELKSGAGDISKMIAPKDAIQSVTDVGAPGYGGPCPPPGAPHEYLITVYALKNKLQLDKTATPAFVGFNLSGSTIAKASIVMYGQR